MGYFTNEIRKRQERRIRYLEAFIRKNKRCWLSAMVYYPEENAVKSAMAELESLKRTTRG